LAFRSSALGTRGGTSLRRRPRANERLGAGRNLGQAVQLDRVLTGKRSEGLRLSASNVVTPIWPESVLRMYVRPKLRPFEVGWINFAVLRRSHSTLNKQRNSDLKIIADQQGHGMRTHLDNVRPERDRRTEGGSVKAVRRFYWGASQTRLIEVDAFWRNLQVVEKMERETGVEPATSSLGN